jgi:hypothetical protein
LLHQIIDKKLENNGPIWSGADEDIHIPAGFSTIDTPAVLDLQSGTISSYGIANLKELTFE